jgi:hypothetical protein
MGRTEWAITKVDEWFTRWHLPDTTKLTAEDGEKALEELEELVQRYAQTK